MGAETEFVAAQKRYWTGVDEAHYAWQTRGGYIAASEAALLDGVTLPPGERLLEIGCGEGANLHHLRARLGARSQLYGVDFTVEKAAHAGAATGALTACADAARLPLPDACFDAVLIRDLLHHLPQPSRALDEALRVLRPGGRLTLVEPNGRNPLIALMAAMVPAERGMLASTAPRLVEAVRAAGFALLGVERRQPLPVSRVIFHYKFGAPGLAGRPSVARIVSGLEAASRLLPAPLHAYVIIHGRKT